MTTLQDRYPRGVLRPELFIGVLSSVTAQTARFSLADAAVPGGSHFLGGRYGKGEVGEFVLLEGQVDLVLGRIVEIKLPDTKGLTPDTFASKNGHREAAGLIQLLGSVSMDSLRVTPGVDSYPRLGDRVYAAPHNFISDLPRLMEPEDSPEGGVFLNLGSIDVAAESPILIRPEKLFGRHCAILGATGGGKSWTTARVVEECLNFQSKVILLDATGEYRGFDRPDVTHVHLGHPTGQATSSAACSLPPEAFSESDFLSLFEPSGKVQGPKLKAAMHSLRMVALLPATGTDGVLKKIGRSKTAFNRALSTPSIVERLDDPSQPFDVSKLAEQIREECCFPDAFPNAGGAANWGGESAEYSHCISLVTRIQAVINAPSFACVFKSSDTSLATIIDNFVNDDKKLLRICLSGISYEFKAREVVANVIGRMLLGRARKSVFKDNPLLVIVDEAHNFLGRHIGGEDSQARLDSFELIAKEGRKYGLNICLTTQRPRDITEGVLSQMGTLVVHRLTNDRDREVVERACGEIDRSASSFLPNLKPGEAAIIGADFPIPITVQINPPGVKPLSDGPNYQKNWSVTRTKRVSSPMKTTTASPVITISPAAAIPDEEEDDIPF